MKTAACYIRVSTDDQLEYSPDSQLAAIRRYAATNDMQLPEKYIFIEQDGISGRKADKRPQFQRMIGTAKLKPKPFDVVLLWKFSRFARNREDSIVYKSMLRKQLGIEVISISENVGDDKMSVIFEAMIEAMDEYYSINLAEEVKRGMTEKARRGEALSIAPFGYKLVNKRLETEQEKAEIIRAVFAKYSEGMPLRRIAEWLNDIGIRTKRGNMIENRTIEYWLRNPVYIGYIRWTPTGKTRRNFDNPNSIISNGTHEPIIEDELWEKVQERIKKQKAAHCYYRRASSEKSYALSGILRCGSCGSTVVKSANGYVQCCGYAHGTCKVSQSAKIDRVTALVFSAIIDDLKNAAIKLVQKEKKEEKSSESEIIFARLEQEKRKLERAKEAYLNGIDSAEEYRRNKCSITEEIERLEKMSKAEKGRPAQKELPSVNRELSLNDFLCSLSVRESEKNFALKLIVEKAVYNKSAQSVEIFYLA